MRKNCSSDQEKLLKLEAEGREFFKIFEITERSEQFLVTECFLSLLEQLEFKLEKVNEI